MNVCPESPGWGELMNWGELDADRWQLLVNGVAGDRAIIYAGHEFHNVPVVSVESVAAAAALVVEVVEFDQPLALDEMGAIANE